MFLTKLRIAKLFDTTVADLTKDRDLELHRFVSGVISGSGWETKDYRMDFVPFQKRFRPKWPELLVRYEASKSNGRVEWACFDEPGKLEFVLHNPQEVSESLPYPNAYASGPRLL
ncbi:hypothetical protein HKX48_000288 [Thoreauomyces humboldtii]|nr:hypothetical protein HKX48_000288 [Thoreauomyces humboldtii]